METTLLNDRLNGLSRTVSRIMSLPGLSVNLAAYHCTENSLLVERYDGVALNYIVKPRRIGAQFSFMEKKYSQGGVYLAPPDVDIVGTSTDQPERYEVVMFSFSPEWLNSVSGAQIDWARLEPGWVSRFQSSFIEQLLRKAAACLRPGAVNEKLLIAVANAAAIELAAKLDGRARQAPLPGRLSPHELRRIDEMLREDSQPMPSVGELAAALGMSGSYLRHLFRESAGETLHERVQRIRLERAVDLLSHTAHPLKQIAYMLGYSHHSTFSSVFSQHLGMSPKAYRNAAFQQSASSGT